MGSQFHCPFLSPEDRVALAQGAKPCPLANQGQMHPCIPPHGSTAQGGILIVGEAPGADEDAQGRPFIGRSGRLLQSCIRQAGVPQSALTISNVVWCRPPGNQTPTPAIVNLCASSHILQTITTLRPAVVVAVGGSALKGLFGGKEIGVRKSAEQVLSHPDNPNFPPVVAGYHPAYILRNGPAFEPSLVRTLSKALGIYQRGGVVAETKPKPMEFWSPPSDSQLSELLRRLYALGNSPIISYDCETRGLDPWASEGNPCILTISLSPDPYSALVIPWDHPEWMGWSEAAKREIKAALSALLEDIPAVHVGQNVKFDDKWLNRHLGINVRQIVGPDGVPNQFDTMLAHAILDPEAPHGLDYLVRSFCFDQYGEYWKEVEKLAHVPGGGVDYSRIPLSKLVPYNARDTMAVAYLYGIFSKELQVRGQAHLMGGHVMRASQALRHVEEAGATLDLQAHAEEAAKLQEGIERATRAFFRQPIVEPLIQDPEMAPCWGDGFNLRSNKHIGTLLYTCWNMPVVKRTKKGQAPSVDRDVLDTLLYSPESSVPGIVKDAVRAVIQFRELEKVQGTYVTPAAGWIGTDGNTHPTFNLGGTATGRLSSDSPNCLSGDTEVLTPQGWVRLDRLPATVPVAQYRPEDAGVEFVQPMAYPTRAGVTEWVDLWSGKNMDLRLTPDHRCLVVDRHVARGVYFAPACRYPKDARQPCAGNYAGGARDLPWAEVALLCATQADGYRVPGAHPAYEFVFQRPRKIERFSRIVSALDIPGQWRAKGEGLQRFRFTGYWAEWLDRMLPGKTFGPWLLEFRLPTLRMFTEEVMYWDGDFTRKMEYSSGLRVNAEWVQTIAALCGRKAHLTTRVVAKGRVHYYVYVGQNSWVGTANVRRTVRATPPMTAYCVTVPSGAILVRRGGRVVVTGNCQNLPKEFRRLFVSRFPEGYILSLDMRQIEARVMASFSADALFLEIFRSGVDFHRMNASLMLGKAYEDVTDDERQRAKSAVSFGLLYGRHESALAADLHIPLEEARAMKETFFSRIPGVLTWCAKHTQLARVRGYVETPTPFLRRRYLPDLSADDRMIRSEAERKAVNTPIQSTASDITLAALVRIDERLQKDYRARVFVTVHDSIVIDTPKEELDAVAEIAIREMEDISRYPWALVPFPCDLTIGRCWTK